MAAQARNSACPTAGSFLRGHAADAAAQGHAGAGAGPLAPGTGVNSIGVNYLIKFTGGVRMR